MSWLSSPKVRLALIVNGLYFISLVVPPSRTARPQLFPQARAKLAERRATVVQPDHIPLSPPSGPSRAAAYTSGGMLHVSLSKDLTLVKRRGRTLMLSPSFSAPALPDARPTSVRLNFLNYLASELQTCPDDCPLTIKADNEVLWPVRPALTPGGRGYSLKRESVPHSSSKTEDGSVVETMAAESFIAEVPYATFLDIISAKRVVVMLGPDWVELTADQIEALRDMHRRLPQPTPPDDSASY